MFKTIKNALNKLRKAVVAAVLAVLVAIGAYNMPDANAQVVSDVVSWTMPTQRVDGSALPIGEIAKTTVAWGTSASGPFPNTQDITSPGATFTFTRSAPGTGTRCYVSYVTDTGNRVSGQAGPVCKTVVAGPNPPTGLQVN